MATRPTKFPEWARLDQPDPVYGVNNVEEPPEAMKDSGWQYKQKPPSNWFNWLHRLYYQWIEYLDEKISLSYGFTTGDVKLTYKKTADEGFLMLDDTTIGNTLSGATHANANLQNLFVFLWDTIPNTYCPVSGGRGTSGLNDFNANKTLTLARILSRVIGIAGQGATLSNRPLGSSLGEESHIIIASEIPNHYHRGGSRYNQVAGSHDAGSSGAGWGQAGTRDNVGALNSPIYLDSDYTGGGGAHNNMQPTSFLNAMIKI
jgi:hypothetical protein